MASAITRFTDRDLNPHFFAYGQFPLYLTYYSTKLTNLVINHQWLNKITFAQAIFGLRLWSAIFSVFSVWLLYRISTYLLIRPGASIIFLYLLIFNPGLIQLAHFGTTESLLILVFAINLWLSIKIIRTVDLKSLSKLLLLASVNTGLGLAAKISAFIFFGPILLSLFFVFFQSASKLKIILLTLVSTINCFLVFILFSPYTLIDHRDFLSTMNYETSVAVGKSVVFYTRQFINTPAYLFQMTKIFPYTNGLVVYLFGFIGLGTFAIKFFQLSLSQKKIWLTLLISCLVYFLYFGQLYTKWTRFMSPLFFLFPLFASFFISKFKHHRLVIVLTFMSCVSGLIFFSQYLQPDIRNTATRFLTRYLPAGSVILSEGGNVVDIPLSNDSQFSVTNFDFYRYDEDIKSQTELFYQVFESQYILIPSRRIFANQFNSQFPYTQKYYQALFNGDLGFVEIAKIQPFHDLFLNEENAEETWSVFDRPTIRVFQKVNQMSLNDYQQILL